jgi:uncharacterized membrane protein
VDTLGRDCRRDRRDRARRTPGTELLGTSWAFIVVKLTLAVAVVAVFVDLGEESAGNGLVVGLAAFAGIWPAVHNVVLFATT